MWMLPSLSSRWWTNCFAWQLDRVLAPVGSCSSGSRHARGCTRESASPELREDLHGCGLARLVPQENAHFCGADGNDFRDLDVDLTSLGFRPRVIDIGHGNPPVPDEHADGVLVRIPRESIDPQNEGLAGAPSELVRSP